MLVLTRKPGEELVFPGLNMIVKVVSVRGNKVRIGIEAPTDIVILRKEVHERDKAAAADAGT